MVTEEKLMSVNRCSVVAPAGCGKTELIVNAIDSIKSGHFLVLTHTHAGVRALRSRFKKKGVLREKINVETIAGWALYYSQAYPVTSLISSNMPTGSEWDNVYSAAEKLLSSEFIQKVLKNTYSGVFVDEYQDCTPLQHKLICKLANIIPCRILGDPLQGIFGFAGASLSWKNDVETFFPSIGTLDVPWRWNTKNKALGLWLVKIRDDLINGRQIDLLQAPIDWKVQDHKNQRGVALSLLEKEEHVVVIRKMPNQAHDFTRGIGKAYVSMEEIECKDLLAFTQQIEPLVGNQRSLKLIEFSKKCMTGLSKISDIENKLRKNSNFNLDRMNDENKLIAESLLAVANSTNSQAILIALRQIEKIQETRIFRPELWKELKKSLETNESGNYESLYKAAWATRNRSRYFDRPLDKYLVSRTLLVKGLEFGHVFIADADEFKGADSAKHFYVAATRGSLSLSIISKESMLRFPLPNI